MSVHETIKYRPDIDGLRAVAVLSVVFFHAFPDLVKGGFIGVDIFFVISGFLISTIIFQDVEQKKFRYMTFYARRIKRIFPALAIILLVCLIFCFVAALPDEARLIGKHVAGGALSISNLLLAKESGYFDVSSNLKPLLHLWSLGVEEQYYILWPLLVSVLFKRFRSFLPIILLLLIASFLLNVCFITKYKTLIFYLPVTRCWELLVGALLAYMAMFNQGLVELVRQRLPSGSKSLLMCHDIIAWLGAILIVISLAILNKNDLFPGWLALLPTVGAFLIISGGPTAWINQKFLSSPVFVFFGLISYPLYLWHWPLLVFPRMIQEEELPILTRILIVIISIILAWITYKFIEKPIRYGKQTVTKPILLSILVAFLGVLGGCLYKATSVPINLHGKTAIMFNELDYEARKNPYKDCPAGLKKSSSALHYCAASSSIMVPTAVVFGDSHADHIFPGIVKQDTNHGWLLAGNPSCPPVKGVSVEADVPECQIKSNSILNYIKSNDNLETVVLSFFGNYFKNTNFAANHVETNLGPSSTRISMKKNIALTRADMFWYGIDKTITELETAGKKIVLVVDIPELPFLPKKCLSRPFNHHTPIDCFVSKQIVLERQDELRINITKLQRQHPRIRVYDPIHLLCDEKNCHAIVNGVLVYRDSHHFSLGGSALFAKHFIPWLYSNAA